MSSAPFQFLYSPRRAGAVRCAESLWSAQVAATVTGWPSQRWNLPLATPRPEAPEYQPPTTGPLAVGVGVGVGVGLASDVGLDGEAVASGCPSPEVEGCRPRVGTIVRARARTPPTATAESATSRPVRRRFGG